MTTISAPGGSIVYIYQNGSTISYSGTVNGTVSSWPVTLVNSDSVPTSYFKIYFITDITLTGGTDRYFICGSSYIQIGNDLLNNDGTQTVITIDGITDYPGLIKNGESEVNGYDEITIKNIGVEVANDSTLLATGGWIGHAYFSNGASSVIQNCYSTGAISVSSGGILGESAGILNSANSNKLLLIENCHSYGNIAALAGGIVGNLCGFISANVQINKCFSAGNINGDGSGGICGGNAADNGTVSVINSYSTGTIIGFGSGGIFGINAGKNTNSIAIAENCYSLGAIQGNNCGGIYGRYAGASNGSATAQNCYSAGFISDSDASGGIFGPDTGTITQNACYAANGSWSDSSAISNLTGVPTTSDVGTTWARTDSINTPYKLITIGYSPYSISLTRTYSQTINVGESSIAAIVTGHTFNILAINGSSPSNYPTITIDSSTGVIQTTGSTSAAIYTIIVYDYINPYSITTVELTVNAIPPQPLTISVPAGYIIAISQSVDGTILYSGAVEGTITSTSWPVTFVNSDPSSELYIKVYFSTNINLTGGTDRYFICGSEYIQIGNDELNTDGTQTVITIDGITNYPGLVKNGESSTNGYDNVTIKNIGVEVDSGSTLLSAGGWIGHNYFSRGVTSYIINCYSIGNISTYSGGIVGALSASGSGIVGKTLFIQRCYSFGNIDTEAGGLTGRFSAVLNGNMEISNCFSIGNINGQYSGGICGAYSAGAATDVEVMRIYITNSYSTGSIIGLGAGGIYGAYSGEDSGNVVANNCYSLGTIQGTNSGGIYGRTAGTGGSATAINCYSTGTIVGGGDRGIFGGSPGNITRTSCYSANGSWSDSTAALYLTGVPTTSDVGTTWARTDGINTPFKLVAIGYSPYSRSLITTFNTTVQAPGETSAAIVTGHTFQILAINGSSPATYPGITINSSTGVISIASTVTSDTYLIVVYDYINPYAITTVEVEVNGQTIVIPLYCCPVTTNANFPVYEIKNNITDYKGMNYDAHNYGKKVFNSYSDYIKYKMARNYICN